jgi:hypothetical protein
MPLVRIRNRVCLGLVTLTLAACGTLGKLDPSPTHSVDLAGNWILNRAASEDPQPLLDKLRPRGGSHLGPMPSDFDPDDGTGPGGQGQGGGGQRRGGRSSRGGGQAVQNDSSYRNINDAYVKVPVIRMLRADIARAEQVTVRQSDERFSLDYGTMVRNFTPGLRSVVSAEWGVADQSSGWKGKEYLIEVKPQNGVASIEKFGLSDDGKHLVEQLRLGGGDFPVVELKRVYDHSDKLLPRAVPSND